LSHAYAFCPMFELEDTHYPACVLDCRHDEMVVGKVDAKGMRRRSETRRRGATRANGDSGQQRRRDEQTQLNQYKQKKKKGKIK
jgi:Fe-S-cluster-containing dehydrogenase component